MPLDITYVVSHIHTDGPIPGPHSLLTVSSVAHTADGDLIGEFTVNVRELAGATVHPVALQNWRERAEDWLRSRRAARPPAVAMNAFVRWVDDLPGTPVFVADPYGNDYLFLYWYLLRFTGRWPFARLGSSEEFRRLPHPPRCALSGCRSELKATS